MGTLKSMWVTLVVMGEGDIEHLGSSLLILRATLAVR